MVTLSKTFSEGQAIYRKHWCRVEARRFGSVRCSYRVGCTRNMILPSRKGLQNYEIEPSESLYTSPLRYIHAKLVFTNHEQSRKLFTIMHRNHAKLPRKNCFMYVEQVVVRLRRVMAITFRCYVYSLILCGCEKNNESCIKRSRFTNNEKYPTRFSQKARGPSSKHKKCLFYWPATTRHSFFLFFSYATEVNKLSFIPWLKTAKCS